jgi:CRP-like cAMP-binding protein
LQSPETVHITGNTLLNSLQGEERERLFRHLRPDTFPQGKTIFHPDELIQRVYFPFSGLVSIVTTSKSGESVEVGAVGYEGLAGLAAILGDGIAYNRRAVVQIESSGVMIEADLLRQEMKRSVRLQEVLLRYAQAYITLVSQSVFCQCFHRIDERLARWLLECQFRAKADEFHLTQEYMAELLGVRRASVTVKIAALNDKGLITHSRGGIKILDQERLEAFACECYEIIRAEFRRLFG